MALIECEECGNEVSDAAKACPKCGANPKKGKSWLFWVLAGLAGLVVVFFLFAIAGANDPKADAKWVERRAIEECWKEQGRKSLDPASQRFIAGACEKMERDFKMKHGRNP